MARVPDPIDYRFSGTVMLNIGMLPYWANDNGVEVVTIWIKEDTTEYGDEDKIISFRIDEFVGLYPRGSDLMLGIHRGGSELTEIFISSVSGINPVIREYVSVMDNIDAHQTPIEFSIEKGKITGMIGTP